MKRSEFGFLSKMKICYKHSLQREEAYRRVNELLSKLQRKYSDKIKNPQMRWNSDNTQMDFSLEIMGFNTTGSVYLRNGEIILEGKLPFMARVFNGRIESIIRGQLEKLLS